MDRLIAVVTFVIVLVAMFAVVRLFNLEVGIVLLPLALLVASTATWVVNRRRKIARH